MPLAPLLAVLATDAVYARSERGFELIPRPYPLESPVLHGVAVDAADPAGVTPPATDDAGAAHGVDRPAQPAYVVVIHAENTPWLRVRFGECNFGSESYVILTSRYDGHQQRLDSWSMPIWQNTSAGFNGGELEIALFVGPRDEGVFFKVEDVLVADPEDFPLGFDPPETICNSVDNRVASSDQRVGRLFFGGCTGWLVHNGAALAAGHCGTPDGNVTGLLEFNVPLSTSNGIPVLGSPDDQYPITGVVSFESDGEGADYAVFTVGPNSNTGLRAHIAQGFFHMTALVPSDGTLLRVTGYGVDPFPPGSGGAGADCCDWDDDDVCNSDCNSASRTQQTSTGACDDCLVGTAIEHTVDTMPANSGSPIIWESNGLAIGIHTNGGCDTIFSDFDNAGTWLGYNPLKSALNNFLGNNVWWVDALSPNIPLFQTGGVLNAFDRVSEATAVVPDGGTIAIVAGNYTAANGNTLTAGADGRAMTLMAHVGIVRIGD
jgi:hypothetical protein